MRSRGDVISPRIPPDATVLEVGCGGHPHARTSIGVDRDRASSQLAATTIPVVRADAQRLPFAAHTFDAVLARGVLHHLSDIDQFLAEAKRTLLPTGQLLILDAEPMPLAEFVEMSRQLTAAGVEPEPRKGIEAELLKVSARQLRCVTMQELPAGRWTHATPPYTDHEFSSPAWLHILRW